MVVTTNPEPGSVVQPEEVVTLFINKVEEPEEEGGGGPGKGEGKGKDKGNEGED